MKKYNLTEDTSQYGFYTSRAKLQIFGGAYGNGKTTALVVKALQLAKDYPGSRGLMARATYPKLNGTLRREFGLWCPPHWVKRKPTQLDNTYYMMNGTTVDFRFVAQRGKNTEDGSTTSNLLSATYDWIMIDQVEDPEIVYKDFTDLFGRLRGDTPYRPEGDEDPTMPQDGPRWFIISCNPTRNWVFRKVVQPYLQWKERGICGPDLLLDSDTGLPLLELYGGSVYENKANLPRDFIKTQEVMFKGQAAKRYVLGEWVAFEGLVYPAYDSARHLVGRQAILDYIDFLLSKHVKVTAIEAYDFGLTAPSCYLLAVVDDYGRVIIIDGYYERDCDYTLQPAMIREIRSRYAGRLSFDNPIEADPAIFRKMVVAGKRNPRGDTVARLLGDFGLQLRAANNDIASGVAKVGSYLGGRLDIPHAFTDEPAGPLLYFCDDLTFIQDEIGAYFWKKDNLGNATDEPSGTDDHAMDTIKYLLSRRLSASEIEVPEAELPPGWMFWREEGDHDNA